MHVTFASHRTSLLGALALILTAGVVGCGSPVAPENASSEAMLKGRKKSTTTTTNVWETEPNDHPATTSDVIASATTGARMGTIGSATDNDYYVTQAVLPGRQIVINLAMPYAKDYDVQLLSRDGSTVIASNHQAAGYTETFYYTNRTTTSQTFLVRVFSADGSSSTTSPYTLMVGTLN